MTDISYDEYRKHMDEIAFMKKKLNAIIIEKREAHAIYRDAYKKYIESSKQQDHITKQILDLLPENV